MGKLRIILMTILLAMSTNAFCDELTPASGWYVRVDGGFSSARDPELKIPSGSLPADLGSSFLYGGGLGYSYAAGLRGDLTFTYRSGFQQVSGFPAMPQGTADFKSLTALVSVYLDLLQQERMSPYVGFGLGMSRNDLGTVTINNVDGSLLGMIQGSRKQNFAWQFCAGGAFFLGNNLLLDAGYHYLSAGDYESEEVLKFADQTTVPSRNRATFRAHELILSLQYTF